ncbi:MULTISPECIES: MFS transporter [unclassified Gilliamella]|uniref:MFS transporter n=1 Tax=unclassified Gilliamella TaxID=2685620 RepID=UPI00080EC1DE|nr:MFS transporter [Gilliamella apicola]OCG37200.1 MFS transporter [Gilliamella apicola]OCG48534.1 MFS transporter [Gilliamella apicola]OCG52957.1 MFS transporter [Gilliamella apicola]
MRSPWYFGWNIVIAASFLTLLSSGLRMSMGVFFLPIANDLNFSRSVLSGIIAIGMLFSGIAMPISGYLVGKYGTRFVLILGSIIIIISTVWSANSTDYWNFFLSFGVALSFGTSFVGSVSFTPIVARWFIKRRGLALFILSTGSMAGIAVMLPVFAFFIPIYGWQTTLISFAVIFMIIALPIALFIMKDNQSEIEVYSIEPVINQKIEPSIKLIDVLKTRPFWQLSFGLFTCGFSMNLLGTHGVPMLIDHGFDPITSSNGIGLIGLVAIFSTLVLGYLSDIVQRKNILMMVYLIRSLGFIALVLASTKWPLFTIAAVGGLVWAGALSMSGAITADIYGVKIVGLLSGLTYLGHQIGAMIGSWLGGWAYDHLHTHLVAFGTASILLLLAAFSAYHLPKR